MSALSPMVSGSPESITATDQAHVQITRFGLQPAIWDKLVVLGLAVSIAVNVWSTLQIREDRMEQRLKQYNLDVYRGEFNDKLSEVRLENMKLFLDKCRRN